MEIISVSEKRMKSCIVKIINNVFEKMTKVGDFLLRQMSFELSYGYWLIYRFETLVGLSVHNEFSGSLTVTFWFSSRILSQHGSVIVLVLKLSPFIFVALFHVIETGKSPKSHMTDRPLSLRSRGIVSRWSVGG